MNWSPTPQARHVTLVPEIEMPGHFLAALAAYPQLSCTGGPFKVRTRWGIEPDVLCPGNDQAIEFAMNVLAEIADMFPGPFIHIGGDEAPRDRWKACPKCQAHAQRGPADRSAAADVPEPPRGEIPGQPRPATDRLGRDPRRRSDARAQSSCRGAARKAASPRPRRGHDVVMSPTSHCYFDYAQAAGPTNRRPSAASSRWRPSTALSHFLRHCPRHSSRTSSACRATCGPSTSQTPRRRRVFRLSARGGVGRSRLVTGRFPRPC